MDTRTHLKKIIFAVSFLLMTSSAVLADEDRHLAVDREIGGVESHIGDPTESSGYEAALEAVKNFIMAENLLMVQLQNCGDI